MIPPLLAFLLSLVLDEPILQALRCNFIVECRDTGGVVVCAGKRSCRS